MIPIELLHRFPFFSFMNERELKAVAAIAQDLHFEAGDILVEADKPADALYFLIDGNLSYYMVVTAENIPDYRREYVIGYINPNEIIGISALIDPYHYTATLRVEKPTRVIRIDSIPLRALCELDVYLSVGLMKAVAKAAMERLEMTRVQLVAEMIKNEEKSIM